MASIDIESLCQGRTRHEETKACNDCGLSPSTGIIDDTDRTIDETLLKEWIHKKKEKIQRASGALMAISRNWYRKHNRKTVFLSVYKNIDQMVHGTSILCVPIDTIEPFLNNELKSLDLKTKMETDPTKTKTPFNPEEHIIWVLMVEIQIHKPKSGNMGEVVDGEDDEEIEDAKSADDDAKAPKPCFCMSVVMSPTNILPKIK